jgi:hypothetical protein
VAAARAGTEGVSRAARALIGVQYVLGFIPAAIAASGALGSGRPGVLSLIVLIAAYVVYAAVGSILVTKRPRNLIGWLLLGIGWTFAVAFLPITATGQQLQTLTASPLQEGIAWLTEWSVSLTFALFAALAFLFPTGRLAEGRWRRLAILVLALIWGIVVLSAFWPVLAVEPGGAGIVEIPNPIGILPRQILDLRLPSDAMASSILPLILLSSVAAIAGRYARAQDLERLQLRWLLAAFGSIAIGVPVGFAIMALVDPSGEIAWIPASLAFMLPPIAIGIAVLRYRLYEIDQIISRTIGWAVVTGIIATLFVGTVVGLQALLADVTQSQTVPVAASTLIAFAVFQPLRRRVQSMVDHRFNRARYDADRTVDAFAERLRDEIDLASLNDDIAGVVDTALRPSAIGVWIRRAHPTAP